MSFFYKIGGKEVVFIHIPKTGGKSLEKSLLPYNPYADLPYKRPARVFAKHLTLSETKELIGENSEHMSFFTSVRNPWARTVSFFHYILQNPIGSGMKEISDGIREDRIKFRDFVFIMTRGNIKVLRSQVEYIQGHEDTRMSFIKQESLSADLNDLLNEMGGSDYVKVPHINKSSHLHYRSYFNENGIIQEIANYESEIISKFNYRF